MLLVFRTADPYRISPGKEGSSAEEIQGLFAWVLRDGVARMVVEKSRPIADVGWELDVSEISLGNWVLAYRERKPKMSRRAGYQDAAARAGAE
jgi:hypothetical protein